MSNELQINQNAESTYSTIRDCVITAQNKVAQTVNTAMVLAYHEIGEQIYLACGENDRAEYGKNLLEFISDKLTAEFGTGFTVRNLRAMRQFYMCFPKRHTLCAELSWSHYRLLMHVKNEEERTFYMTECAKSAWSVRQLERQIHTMFYRRRRACLDIAANCSSILYEDQKDRSGLL